MKSTYSLALGELEFLRYDFKKEGILSIWSIFFISLKNTCQSVLWSYFGLIFLRTILQGRVWAGTNRCLLGSRSWLTAARPSTCQWSSTPTASGTSQTTRSSSKGKIEASLKFIRQLFHSFLIQYSHLSLSICYIKFLAHLDHWIFVFYSDIGEQF